MIDSQQTPYGEHQRTESNKNHGDKEKVKKNSAVIDKLTSRFF